MTIDEAIKNREDCLKYLEEIGPKASHDCLEAVRWSVKALKALRPVSRERVERMAGEWVQDINKGPAVFYCSSCGESFEIHSYEFQKYRFCPFCMSPMSDEAVDIVIERREALQNEIR